LDKVLVDTSVWIEFFRKKEPHFSTVSELMEADAICCTGIIYAELLQGAKTEKELATIKEFAHVFDFIAETDALWEKAGELSFNLRKKGIAAGLSDCYIAVAAQSANASLLTLDKHFSAIKKLSPVRIYGT
jgi:predicted nucleic acid-binding protein